MQLTAPSQIYYSTASQFSILNPHPSVLHLSSAPHHPSVFCFLHLIIPHHPSSLSFLFSWLRVSQFALLTIHPHKEHLVKHLHSKHCCLVLYILIEHLVMYPYISHHCIVLPHILALTHKTPHRTPCCHTLAQRVPSHAFSSQSPSLSSLHTHLCHVTPLPQLSYPTALESTKPPQQHPMTLLSMSSSNSSFTSSCCSWSATGAHVVASSCESVRLFSLRSSWIRNDAYLN